MPADNQVSLKKVNRSNAPKPPPEKKDNQPQTNNFFGNIFSGIANLVSKPVAADASKDDLNDSRTQERAEKKRPATSNLESRPSGKDDDSDYSVERSPARSKHSQQSVPDVALADVKDAALTVDLKMKPSRAAAAASGTAKRPISVAPGNRIKKQASSG